MGQFACGDLGVSEFEEWLAAEFWNIDNVPSGIRDTVEEMEWHLAEYSNRRIGASGLREAAGLLLERPISVSDLLVVPNPHPSPSDAS